MFSPRMWRWSQCKKCARWFRWVFSTYVEVILASNITALSLSSFLHVCGGDPRWFCNTGKSITFSPRMWRWSYLQSPCHSFSTVFSTYVEVILRPANICHLPLCFLHVCGGDPSVPNFWLCILEFSPRMWRWSWNTGFKRSSFKVFSTYVEVILKYVTI